MRIIRDTEALEASVKALLEDLNSLSAKRAELDKEIAEKRGVLSRIRGATDDEPIEVDADAIHRKRATDG